MSGTSCSTRRHGLGAYEAGCRCPEVVEQMRARWRERSRRLPRGSHRPGPKPGFDPIAVELASFGDRRPLSTAELHAAVEQLSRRGLSLAEVARRLGASTRTVARHRAALREERRVA
jgi:DNA-binding NarL/FixJ family response regulator